MMTNINEEWKDIEGYEGLYQISNLGRVKSLRKNIIMKEKKAGRGQYKSICLKKDGCHKYITIHRLVAQAFIPNPNNLPQVNHKDENPANNIWTNLEWCDNKYNHNYGTGHKRAAEKIDYDKISIQKTKQVTQYDLQDNKIQTFISVNEASRQTGIAQSGITRCCNGIYKSTGGYKWDFTNFKTLFICSDMHGYYDETIECLHNTGYNEDNPNHLLVCLGDFTDRGSQSLELCEYLYKLSQENKAIVLPGNHTKFLIEYLDGTTNNPFNYLNNGVDETFASLLGRTRPFESWCLIDKQIEQPTYNDFAIWLGEVREEINNTYYYLLPWLKSLPRYFETQNYIMVHGAIDTQAIDWRQPHCIRHNLIDWDALDFDDGSFLGQPMTNTNGKTVVAGHFHTNHLRHKYGLIDEDKEDHSILDINDYRGHKIFIDGCTPYTKDVNVLVIENEELL